jgi:GTPase SAR1 family protein
LFQFPKGPDSSRGRHLFVVNEIKISVTQEKFLKKSWKVGKKKLHQRKIVPVIIWDFGGQDVFYSTHQTLARATKQS